MKRSINWNLNKRRKNAILSMLESAGFEFDPDAEEHYHESSYKYLLDTWDILHILDILNGVIQPYEI